MQTPRLGLQANVEGRAICRITTDNRSIHKALTSFAYANQPRIPWLMALKGWMIYGKKNYRLY
jgi:hypothetical protein